jgi:hypothetical protein
VRSSLAPAALTSQLRRELHGHDPKSTRWRSVEKAFVIVVLCVTAFWATSNYAVVIGNQVANATISHVSDLTSVTVYAVQRLGISGPGTHQTPITGVGEIYRYRYTGLRQAIGTFSSRMDGSPIQAKL